MHGSALGNPGACGAAAVCYPTRLSDQPLIIWTAISSRSTRHYKELFALKLAIEFCTDWRKPREVHIISDCQSAISSVTSADLHRSHQDVIDDIRSSAQALSSQSTIVNPNWIAGHVLLKRLQQRYWKNLPNHIQMDVVITRKLQATSNNNNYNNNNKSFIYWW